MGCDIHVQLEVFWKGQWVGLAHHSEGTARHRNYERFARLAGVRCDDDYEHRGTPAGMPEDASPLSQMEFEGWGQDAHSASWLPLRDFVRICLETEFDPENVFLDPKDKRGSEPYHHYFGLYIEETEALDDYRVVFWFDN